MALYVLRESGGHCFLGSLVFPKSAGFFDQASFNSEGYFSLANLLTTGPTRKAKPGTVSRSPVLTASWGEQT